MPTRYGFLIRRSQVRSLPGLTKGMIGLWVHIRDLFLVAIEAGDILLSGRFVSPFHVAGFLNPFLLNSSAN